MRLLLLGLLLLTGCSPTVTTQVGDDDDDTATCTTGLTPGDCPPDFAMTLADGGEFNLSDVTGNQRVIVLGSSNW